MSFSQENGYTPVSFNTLMAQLREGINTQFGTTYDEETFVGTNWYKFAYTLIQKVQQNEIKASEIFLKLQEYIALTNESISRSVITFNGLIDVFKREGFLISVKPPLEADAGKVNICADVDETDPSYAATKLKICELIRDNVAAGMVTFGSESETLPIGNTQSFDFKYHLPDRIPVKLRLTLTLSNNNDVFIESPQTVRQILFSNINSRYQLGKDFEPKRYFAQTDAPWTSDILLEWSTDDGENWSEDVFVAEFDELYTFELEDITVIED